MQNARRLVGTNRQSFNDILGDSGPRCSFRLGWAFIGHPQNDARRFPLARDRTEEPFQFVETGVEIDPTPLLCIQSLKRIVLSRS